MRPATPRVPIAHLFLPALLTLMLTGCGQHSQFASQLATPTRAIAVEANVDGKGNITTSLNGNAPNVTFNFGDNRKVIIDQNKIMVDDETYPAAPAGTKLIGINVRNGIVKLTADGQPITKQ